MSQILLTILIVIGIALLMAVQAVISKGKLLYWGAIIPLGVLIVAAYAYFSVSNYSRKHSLEQPKMKVFHK